LDPEWLPASAEWIESLRTLGEEQAHNCRTVIVGICIQLIVWVNGSLPLNGNIIRLSDRTSTIIHSTFARAALGVSKSIFRLRHAWVGALAAFLDEHPEQAHDFAD
jgi:hypothetical protein